MLPSCSKCVFRSIIISSKSAEPKRATFQHRFYSLLTRSTVQLSFTHHKPTALNFDATETENIRIPKPLVIVHGLFGQKSNFNSIAKQLTNRLHTEVFTVDLRNHGESPWHDSVEYLDFAADVRKFIVDNVLPMTKQKRVDLLGHSLGGKAVGVLALSDEGHDVIDRLIIEDVMMRDYFHADKLHDLIEGYIRSMLALRPQLSYCKTVPEARALAHRELKEFVPDIRVRQFLLTNLAEREGMIDWKVNIQVIHRNTKKLFGFPEFLIKDRMFTHPTLIMTGQESKYVRPEDDHIFHALFPHVLFSSIPNAGHWVHADQPYAFIDALCDFLTMKEV